MTKTDTKSAVLLKHHLKALKRPTVAAECEKVAQRAAADKPTTWPSCSRCANSN